MASTVYPVGEFNLDGNPVRVKNFTLFPLSAIVYEDRSVEVLYEERNNDTGTVYEKCEIAKVVKVPNSHEFNITFNGYGTRIRFKLSL